MSDDAGARAYSAAPDGVRIAIRVTPRASRTALAGRARDEQGREMLAVRLAAPPVDGAANEALVAFLAKGLKVARSQVRIVSGETGRRKLVEIAGIDLAAVDAWVGD